MAKINGFHWWKKLRLLFESDHLICRYLVVKSCCLFFTDSKLKVDIENDTCWPDNIYTPKTCDIINDSTSLFRFQKWLKLRNNFMLLTLGYWKIRASNSFKVHSKFHLHIRLRKVRLFLFGTQFYLVKHQLAKITSSIFFVFIHSFTHKRLKRT